MSMNGVYERFLSKANNDLKIALDELKTDEPVLDMVCFHLQQFVEKYLKAFLIRNTIPLTRTHSIPFLLSQCIDLNEEFNRFLETPLLELNECGVAIRYDDIESVDREFIENVLGALYQLKDFVERRIDECVLETENVHSSENNNSRADSAEE